MKETFTEMRMRVAVVAKSVAGHLGLFQICCGGFVNCARAAHHHHIVLGLLQALESFSLSFLHESTLHPLALTHRTRQPSRPDNGITVFPVKGLTPVPGLHWCHHLLLCVTIPFTRLKAALTPLLNPAAPHSILHQVVCTWHLARVS
jgi:hypothetical protein